MEMQIFNHILFDSLMPWVTTSANIRQMRDNQKKCPTQEPTTLADLVTAEAQLLQSHPALLQWISQQDQNATYAIKPLTYSTALPQYHDIATKFYQTLIDFESLRIFTGYNIISDKYQHDDDLLIYHTENALRNIKHYIKTAGSKIKEGECQFEEGTTLELTPFVLFYLKFHLITLYFSIQLINRDILDQVWEPYDFWLLELEESAKDFHAVFQVFSATQKNNHSKLTPKRLTFGFNGKKEKLSQIINLLCVHADLLKEEHSPADLLISLFLSHDIAPGETKIYLDCDNKAFKLIIVSLKPMFNDLSYNNIELSNSFLSKGGKPLTANDISKAANPKPKTSTSISRIFQQMQ